MFKRSILCVLCVGCFALSPSRLPAQDNVPVLHDLFVAKPSNAIFHGLEVKTADDSEKRWVSLKGPKFYSAPVKQSGKQPPDYLTWYEIRKPKPERARVVKLTDDFSGEQSFTVTLGDPAFFAMPAQTLADGPPAEVPESLNHFIAFRIQNADSVELPEPTPGKPAFVCLPAEEFHHGEHFPIKTPARILMVYELQGPSESSTGNDSKATIIDQFGLNRLTLQAKKMQYAEANLTD